MVGSQHPGVLRPEIQDQNSMSTRDVRAQVERIQQLRKDVMKKGIHYDTVPGTIKDTLLKPGAEILMLAFRISNELKIEDLSNTDERRFRVLSRAIHIPSGKIIGEGIGEASTSEEKYKWRSIVCDAEFLAFPADSRREKFKKDGTSYKQVRTNPSDISNTVLKMAKKRAQVDMVLTTTAASEMFTQDLEDDIDDSSQGVSYNTPAPVQQANFLCSDCGVKIISAVHEFSIKKFKKPLCRPCQDKVNG